MTSKRYEVSRSVKLNKYPEYDESLRFKAKSLDHVGHSDKKSMVIDSVRLNKYLTYDAFLFERVEDTRQNKWTMKSKSH